MAGGGERRGRGADLGDDLLRRIDTQPGHLCQPLHLVLVLDQQVGQFLVDLAELLCHRLRELAELGGEALRLRLRERGKGKG